MFRASKQHAIGTYHGKQRHGMLVLHALNKTHLVNMLQKPTEMMIASMQNMASDLNRPRLGRI